MMQLTNQPGGVQLRGRMTIVNARSLAAELLPLLGTAAALEVVLAEVGEIDSAGLQLMLICKRECAGVRFVQPSAAVLQALEETGLTGLLQ